MIALVMLHCCAPAALWTVDYLRNKQNKTEQWNGIKSDCECKRKSWRMYRKFQINENVFGEKNSFKNFSNMRKESSINILTISSTCLPHSFNFVVRLKYIFGMNKRQRDVRRSQIQCIASVCQWREAVLGVSIEYSCVNFVMLYSYMLSVSPEKCSIN